MTASPPRYRAWRFLYPGIDAERDPEATERLNVRLVYRVRATRQVVSQVVPVELAAG